VPHGDRHSSSSSPRFKATAFGSELVHRVVQEAIAGGVSIRLSVLNGNPAGRLYDRLGFKVGHKGKHATMMRFTNEKRDPS
jgi:ribosomal protein S18 acetylase RimI-like enzyme